MGDVPLGGWTSSGHGDGLAGGAGAGDARVGDVPVGDAGVSDAFVGAPTWPSLPDQQLVEPRSTYGPSFAPPPVRRPGSGGRPIVIAAVVVVLALVVLALLGAMAVNRLDSGLTDVEDFTAVGGPLPGRMVDPEAPPEISNPPADGDAAQAAIADLVQFVFTPNPDPAAWEARFTDPASLRAKIEPFASTLCAVGVGTHIVSIEFLEENRALVEFVFLGPNIPEIGRTFAFRGHVRRADDGRWIAEPDLVENVAGLASGFCLQQDVTSREGIEDDTAETGTHEPGNLVDPLSP